MSVPSQPRPPSPAPGATATPEGPRRSVRLAHALGWANLWWLGLLAPIATFGALYGYGVDRPLFRLVWGGELILLPVLLFLGGIVGTIGYFAIVYGYLDLPDSPWTALLVLLDGPIVAALALPKGAKLGGFAIQGFLVDGIAVWCTIAWLSLGRAAPPDTPKWTPAVVAFGIVGILTICSGYAHALLYGHLLDIGLLVAGIAWSTHNYVRLLARKGPGANQMHDVPLLVMMFLWLIAAGIGLANGPS